VTGEGSRRFIGRVAVVTGGANGMGEATARLLAEEGAHVAILDRDAERTPAVVESIAAAGGSVESFIIDVRDEDQVSDAVGRIAHMRKRIDILDNNAAALELAAHDGDLLSVDAELLLESVRGDLLPNFLLTKHVLPHMIAQSRGSIVNIASISGMMGELSLTAYGIAKAGVIQLTRATAVQYARHGVRCNAIAPSYVTTRNNAMYAPVEFAEIYANVTPLPRAVAPEDVAAAVAFLASDASSLVTGHILPVDGGVLAASPIVPGFREWMSQLS